MCFIISLGTENVNPEVATTRYGSGGGFSDYFAAPAYQRYTIDSYISDLDGKYNGLYNEDGRGYPDVAAQGNIIATIWANETTYVGGTSASAPIFAAVIALVNDALIAKEKPVLGFLNPWLYGGGWKGLTDITKGSSSGEFDVKRTVDRECSP